MSDPANSCPFDLLDASMRDPFLQQAFRHLDQRHLYGVIPRVCHSWHRLSTTSSNSLKVRVSAELNEETGEPDAAFTSFSRWLQHNLRNLTSLDLTLDREGDSFDAGPEMLQTIASATQLCSLGLSGGLGWRSESFAGLSALTNLASLALCNGDVSPAVFSSMLALTQLRALDLNKVGVLVRDDDYDMEEEIMPPLTSSLVNLTSLSLDVYACWFDLEGGLACLRSLTKLVALDIRNKVVPSGNLVNVLGRLPITGVEVALSDPGHVCDVAGWLERCVPTTLRYLEMRNLAYGTATQPTRVPSFELHPSQVARLLSPLRSAGKQLQVLKLRNFDLTQIDSVNIITGLTQLTSLNLFCKFHDDGWALLEPAFAHFGVLRKERLRCPMSWFRATKAALC